MSTGGLPETRWRWAWQVGFAALILAVLGGLLAGPYRLLLGTMAGSMGEEARVAPCLPGEPVEIMDSPYVSQADVEDARYNSLPPTSGPHLAFTIAPGVYDHPVPDGLAIHAMEHGHVIIHYAEDTPDALKTELDRLARRYGADVILAPNPSLMRGVALTAWGRIDHLDSYDESRVTEFVEALRGRYHHGWTADRDCPPG